MSFVRSMRPRPSGGRYALLEGGERTAGRDARQLSAAIELDVNSDDDDADDDDSDATVELSREGGARRFAE